MKKILYLGGFELPDKNAAAQRVMANSKLLREIGYEVKLIGVSKDIAHAPKHVEGFECAPITYPVGIKQWFRQILTFLNTDQIIQEKPAYVVLYNFPAIASLKILRSCHKHGIKVIHDLTEWENAEGWTPRNIIRKLDINLRMRYCMKKMDGIICISRYLFNHFSKYTQCIYVPPTIDIQDPKWNRDRTFTIGENKRLVYAGSIGKRKKDQIDAIIKAVQQTSGVELDVLGATLEQHESVYGKLTDKTDNIRFLGRLSHKETVNTVCNSDFQMLIRNHSLKNDAGFPTKFVESFSCCTPVIATLTSNISDYLESGVNGYVVDEVHSLESVLSYIAKLQRTEIIKLKENCKAVNCFDYRNYNTEFYKLFK